MPMQRPARWTLAQMHRLPDDGNRYELVHGELFVTPAPSYAHQSIVTVLTRILFPYVQDNGLGDVISPRSVVRIAGSEVEPDLMVRPRPLKIPRDWEDAPLPILVVEVLSGSTRRRDHMQKRDFYLENGIPDYWIMDGKARTIRVVRMALDDEITEAHVTWHPPLASSPLLIDVAALYREALGPR